MCFFSSAASVSPCNCWLGQKPRANPFPSRAVTRYIFRAWFFAESHSRLLPRPKNQNLDRKNGNLLTPVVCGTRDGGENEINKFLLRIHCTDMAAYVWSMTSQWKRRYHRSKLSTYVGKIKFSFVCVRMSRNSWRTIRFTRDSTSNQVIRVWKQCSAQLNQIAPCWFDVVISSLS